MRRRPVLLLSGLGVLTAGTAVAIAMAPVSSSSQLVVRPRAAATRTVTTTVTATRTVTTTATVTAPGPTVTVTAPGPTTTVTVTASPSSTPTDTGTPTPTTTAPTTTAPPPSAYPDATNTGVPAGTQLTKMGDVTITQPGTVIQNAEVDGCVTLRDGANNVTIRNSLIKSAGCFWLVDNHSTATNLQVVDTEIDGMGNTSNDAGVGGVNFTLTRVNIHNTIDGVKIGDSSTIQDSWIHDLTHTSTSHNDGVQSLGGTGMTLRHNTIINNGDGTAIILSTGSGEMHDVLFDNNLLGGGGFTVYGGCNAAAGEASRVSNIHIVNNKFTTVIYPNSGWAGPLVNDDPPVVHTGNVWYDGPNVGMDLD